MEEIIVNCPYCGESFTTLIDPSAGGQDYFEDCQVCCRGLTRISHQDRESRRRIRGRRRRSGAKTIAVAMV